MVNAHHSKLRRMMCSQKLNVLFTSFFSKKVYIKYVQIIQSEPGTLLNHIRFSDFINFETNHNLAKIKEAIKTGRNLIFLKHSIRRYRTLHLFGKSRKMLKI